MVYPIGRIMAKNIDFYVHPKEVTPRFVSYLKYTWQSTYESTKEVEALSFV